MIIRAHNILHYQFMVNLCLTSAHMCCLFTRLHFQSLLWLFIVQALNWSWPKSQGRIGQLDGPMAAITNSKRKQQCGGLTSKSNASSYITHWQTIYHQFDQTQMRQRTQVLKVNYVSRGTLAKKKSIHHTPRWGMNYWKQLIMCKTLPFEVCPWPFETCPTSKRAIFVASSINTFSRTTLHMTLHFIGSSAIQQCSARSVTVRNGLIESNFRQSFFNWMKVGKIKGHTEN